MSNGRTQGAGRGVSTVLSFLCIVILGVAVYFPILNAEFSTQELSFLVWAKYARPIDYLYRLIPFRGEMAYRPLYYYISAFYCALWGDNAPLFHQQLLAVHLVNACLLFFVAFRLSRSATVSLLTALFFVVTPLSVEAVSLISFGIDDTYSMLFILLSFLCFIKIDDGPARRRAMTVASFSFCVLALFTRESAVMLAPVLILCDLLVLRPRKGKGLIPYLRERWMLHGCYFFLAIAFVLLRHWLLGGLMGRGTGGKTYMPPLLEIARDLFLRLPGLLVLPLKYSTVNRILPGVVVPFVTRPYLVLAAFLLLCFLTVSARKIRWPLVVFGMAWCYAGILVHWQVLHGIGVISQDLEWSHYLYHSTAGFYLAVSVLFIQGKTGWERGVTTVMLAAILTAYGVVSRSYAATYRYAFRLRHLIQMQFDGMQLRLPQDSQVYLIDVPTLIEGALVFWGGTTMMVWNDPEPSTKPVFELGMWHHTIEPAVRARYPYRIFFLDRNVEIEKRRNEYEAAPHFSLDYLKGLDIGGSAYFLVWNMRDERLDDISPRIATIARARKQAVHPVSVRTPLDEWRPFGDSVWGQAGDGDEWKLRVGRSGSGLQAGGLAIPPDACGNLVLEMRSSEPSTLGLTLQYTTSEEPVCDEHKRVSAEVTVTRLWGTISLPLTRRIHDLLDGDITGLRLLFSGRCPMDLAVRRMRVE